MRETTSVARFRAFRQHSWGTHSMRARSHSNINAQRQCYSISAGSRCCWFREEAVERLPSAARRAPLYTPSAAQPYGTAAVLATFGASNATKLTTSLPTLGALASCSGTTASKYKYSQCRICGWGSCRTGLRAARGASDCQLKLHEHNSPSPRESGDGSRACCRP